MAKSCAYAMCVADNTPSDLNLGPRRLTLFSAVFTASHVLMASYQYTGAVVFWAFAVGSSLALYLSLHLLLKRFPKL